MGKRYLRRRLLSFSLALCMLLTLFPVRTRASVYEGDCGAVNASDVQWAFDDETGVLTITGSGPMADYSSGDNTPWADYHYHAVTSVQIEEGVTRVGNYAFDHCYNLTDASLPSGLTNVGDYAFHDCTSLTSVTIPDSMESIGEWAFYSCTSLTSVIIPAGLKSLGWCTFAYCQNLSSVTFSEGLESIGSDVFKDCYNLTSLTIPKSVTYIADGAFPGSLTPDVYMDTYAWRYCMSNNIACSVLDGDGKTYTAAGECGADGDNLLWKLDADGLLTIYGNGDLSDFDPYYSGPWHDYADRIQTVEIQSGVTSVGVNAFYSYNYSYPNLTAVSLPDTLTSIGEQAFYNCDALKSVTVPATVAEIWNGAFGDCENLLLTVTENSPAYAYALRETVPFKLSGNNTPYRYAASGECGAGVYWALDGGTLTIFGSGAMSDFDPYDSGPWHDYADSIQTVEIQSGVTSVGANAFYSYNYSYPNLTALSLPNGLTFIGTQAFYNCDALSSVTIPDSVTEIGGSAFGDCETLVLTVTQDSAGYAYAMGESIPFKFVGGDTTYDYDASGVCGADGASVYWTLDGDTLTVFGSGAMYDYDNYYNVPWNNWSGSVKTVDIHSGVTYISYQAFYGFGSLTSVTLPDSLTSIGDYAFHDCDALKSIGIPDSVTSIGAFAFYGCNALSSVAFPAKLVSIGENAFAYCHKLSSPAFPDKLASIGNSAFYDCDGLITITLPDSVTSVGDYAFYNCDALASLTLSANLASVGDGAFQYCYAIRNLTLPAKVSEIGKDAFKGCNRLTALTIPATVNTIGEGAFRECGELLLTVTQDSGGHVYAVSDGVPFKLAGDTSGAVRVGGYCGENVAWLLNWNSGLLEITGSGDMISNPWNPYNDKIKTATVGNGVTSVCDYAFNYCYSLTSVTLPDTLTSIGYQSFYSSGLTSVKVPDKVTTIGSDAFSCCGSLATVTLPAKLTKVEAHVFYDCNALTSVTIPDGVLSVDTQAFYSCDALESVTIPASVVSIDDYAFRECPNLALIVTENSEAFDYAVRENITYSFAGSDTFYHRGSCGAGLEDNVIWILDSNSGLMTISGSGVMRDFGSDGYQPWHDFRNEIKSVSVAPGVKSVGSYAFYDCGALSSVTIPDSVTSVGPYAFQSCGKLESVTLPSNLASIGEWAFAYCAALASVEIPASVDTVGYAAFYDCDALASVEIPDSVTSIGSIAFNDCENLVLTVTENQESYACALRDGVRFRFAGEERTCRGGYCGSDESPNSVAWILDSNGILTVKGSGAMREFYDWDRPAWYQDQYRGEIKSVSVADGVTSVGSGAFQSCDALESVTIGGAVASIGDFAFAYCGALTSVTIPGNVTQIGSAVFCDCDALESVTIPGGVTQIGSNAFCDCDALASVTISDGVISIDYQAFYSCDALASVTIPASVKEIGESVFGDCNNLVLTVTKDSPAHNYALSNYLRYRLAGSDTVYVDWGDCGERDERQHGQQRDMGLYGRRPAENQRFRYHVRLGLRMAHPMVEYPRKRPERGNRQGNHPDWLLFVL